MPREARGATQENKPAMTLLVAAAIFATLALIGVIGLLIPFHTYTTTDQP